ncbi:MAG: 50S ribosome-binding GTPase [Planctomycetota bacterium]|nr:50S ribosome-binding GTPase [Planctomycetota bacterium]
MVPCPGQFRRLTSHQPHALVGWQLTSDPEGLRNLFGLSALPELELPQWLSVPSMDGSPLDEGILTLWPIKEEDSLVSAELFLHGGAGVTEGFETSLRHHGWNRETKTILQAQSSLLHAQSPLQARVALARLKQTPAQWLHSRSWETEYSLIELKAQLLRWKPWTTLCASPPRIVLAGPPNSGKSSIFNAWLQKEKVTVSPYAGTTRDSVEAGILLGEGANSFEVTLVDTAGLGGTCEGIDQEAQLLSAQEIQRAWCVIEVLDLSQKTSPQSKFPSFSGHHLKVAHRADLPPAWTVPTGESWMVGSVLTEGSAWIQRLVKAFWDWVPPCFPLDFPLPTNEQEWDDLLMGLSEN